jgi:hypothetical protein
MDGIGKSCPMKGGGGYHSLPLASVGRGFLSVGCGAAMGLGIRRRGCRWVVKRSGFIAFEGELHELGI